MRIAEKSWESRKNHGNRGKIMRIAEKSGKARKNHGNRGKKREARNNPEKSLEFKLGMVQIVIQKEKTCRIYFLQVPLFPLETKRQRERRNRRKNLWGSVSLLRFETTKLTIS